MVNRENYDSGTKWEPLVGYSRAVRVGNVIYVSGTTATDEHGNIVGENNAYLQTIQIIKNIETALAHFGATLDDVVRTRMYVVDIQQWEEIGRAHAQFFGKIRPATTMIEVKRLIDPKMLIEMEAVAVISPTESNTTTKNNT